jgi:phage gp16-like protein
VSGVRAAAIAKVHVAQKALALDDGTYRALLARVTGKRSCATMTEVELAKVIKEFRRLGWRDVPRAPRRAGRRALAMGAPARKIRALWLSLWQLGELTDPSEEALAAFVLRTTGVEALQWIDSVQAAAVIRALLGWQERIGLRRANAAHMQSVDGRRQGAGLPLLDAGFGHKVWLIAFQWQRLAQLAALGRGLAEWLARHFAAASPALLTPENADRAIERLGRMIRAAKALADERPPRD